MVMPHKYNYFYFSREKIPGVKKSKRKYHWAADSVNIVMMVAYGSSSHFFVTIPQEIFLFYLQEK